MGFRFGRRKKLLPGLSASVGKRGLGIRIGGRGAGLSLGPSGKRVSASLPRTGVSYTHKIGGKKASKSGAQPTTGEIMFAVLLLAIVGCGVWAFVLSN